MFIFRKKNLNKPKFRPISDIRNNYRRMTADLNLKTFTAEGKDDIWADYVQYFFNKIQSEMDITAEINLSPSTPHQQT